MKKVSLILSLVLTLLLAFGTVTAFANGAEIEEIPYNFETEDIYADEDINEMLESVFGEFGEEIIGLAVISSMCLLLFVPVLVVMIVFIVLNSKTKKKIREYQNLQLYAPVNVSGIFSQSGNFQNPPPVNVTPEPAGNNPVDYQNTVPKNNSNEQGGKF